jgi:hypothetical protein
VASASCRPSGCSIFTLRGGWTDRPAYALYGLTDDEIKIVEEAT